MLGGRGRGWHRVGCRRGRGGWHCGGCGGGRRGAGWGVGGCGDGGSGCSSVLAGCGWGLCHSGGGGVGRGGGVCGRALNWFHSGRLGRRSCWGRGGGGTGFVRWLRRGLRAWSYGGAKARDWPLVVRVRVRQAHFAGVVVVHTVHLSQKRVSKDPVSFRGVHAWVDAKRAHLPRVSHVAVRGVAVPAVAAEAGAVEEVAVFALVAFSVPKPTGHFVLVVDARACAVHKVPSRAVVGRDGVVVGGEAEGVAQRVRGSAKREVDGGGVGDAAASADEGSATRQQSVVEGVEPRVRARVRGEGV
mmetsp:Transcript_48005/g.89520  ORF Transcript_48005/g.89520 Transcript_48005/m.89520 type:complete len:301 (-) Transcript_48005:271-1173(-)